MEKWLCWDVGPALFWGAEI